MNSRTLSRILKLTEMRDLHTYGQLALKIKQKFKPKYNIGSWLASLQNYLQTFIKICLKSLRLWLNRNSHSLISDPIYVTFATRKLILAMVHAVAIVPVQNQSISIARILPRITGIRASFEQFGTTVTNTFPFRFSTPKTGRRPVAPLPCFFKEFCRLQDSFHLTWIHQILCYVLL